MSLASTRLSLIHTCTVQRDNASGVGADGWENQPDFEDHLTGLPCRAWVPSGREVIAGKESVTQVDDVRMIVTLDTDVTESDRVTDITYRGAVVQPGTFGVRAVLGRKDHLELQLMRVQ